MNEAELNSLLLESFPEIKNDFDDYVSWQDAMDTGCFLTFEDLLLPVARRALKAGDSNMLERIGAFTETLMGSGDEYAVNVATVAILEGLKAEGDPRVRSHLGAISLAEYDGLTY